MKDRFIELAALVVDIANTTDNLSFIDHGSTKNLPSEHRGRVKIRDEKGILIDDTRFECNIFPNALSNMAQRLNQALHIDEYAYQWFEYDFGNKIIVPAINPAAVKEKAIDILTYATQHDCWNYDHFLDNDGQIKERIYLEKSYVIGLLNRHHIKNSFKPDSILDSAEQKKIKLKHAKELCEQLKSKGFKEEKITLELLNFYPDISNYWLGILVRPTPPCPDPKNETDCYRGRGKMLKNKAAKGK